MSITTKLTTSFSPFFRGAHFLGLRPYDNVVSHHAAHGAEAVMEVAKRLVRKSFDFTIVVAHGSKSNSAISESTLLMGSRPEERVLNSPSLLPSLFPSIWKNHKILIVCEGLNLDVLRNLAVGLPDHPVSETSVLIAKVKEVAPEEAVRLIDGIFGKFDSSGPLPSNDRVLTALRTSGNHNDWYGIEGSNVVGHE